MKTVHVAVAVIENAQGQILIAKRPDHLHMGGFWEFPGGKLEPGESVFGALQREIKEELALQVHSAEPILRIPFDYPEKSVVLHVWRVTHFSGVEQSVESQPLRWVYPSELAHYTFPPANRGILTALQLSPRMLITGSFQTEAECLARVRYAVEQQGISCVQFRAHQLPGDEYRHLAVKLHRYCESADVKLLLNSTPLLVLPEKCGLHLSGKALAAIDRRPVKSTVLLGASCHNDAELSKALSLPVDYVTFSPIHTTSTHPEQLALGWEALTRFVDRSSVPVFALGGMRDDDLEKARQCGAVGVAAINAWW